MPFLAVLRRRIEAFAEADFTALLDPEAARMRQLYAAGVVREVFSRGDVAGAVIRLEVADEAAARAVLELQALVQLVPYRGFV